MRQLCVCDIIRLIADRNLFDWERLVDKSENLWLKKQTLISHRNDI